MVDYLQRQGSAFTLADFASHRSEWVDVACTAYRNGYELCELPPNAPGAASIATSVGAESSEHSHVSIIYSAEGVVSRVAVDWMSVGHDDMDMSVAVGSTVGGDRVRVDGAYFVDGDAGGMRFGTVGPVRARWLTRDALESISPAQRPGGAAPASRNSACTPSSARTPNGGATSASDPLARHPRFPPRP